MKVETESIIISKQKYKEYDEIIVAFTRKYGKVRMFSSSSNNLKSPLHSGSQLFSHSKLTINLKDNGSRLYNAKIIKSFYEVSSDMSKYFLMSYIVELIDKTLPEHQTNTMLFDYTVKIMNYMLNSTNLRLIRVVFELLYIDTMGFKPTLDTCGRCKESPHNQFKYFNMEEGTVICDRCRINDKDSIRIDKNMIEFMKFVYKYSNDIKRIMNVKISKKLLNKTLKFVHNFLKSKLGNIHINSYSLLLEEEKSDNTR